MAAKAKATSSSSRQGAGKTKHTKRSPTKARAGARAAKASGSQRRSAAQSKKVAPRKRQDRPSTQANTRSKLAGAQGKSPSRRTPPLVQTLCAEHRYMGSVLEVFAAQLDAIAAGELVDPHLVYEIMDYMVTWPDRFHHPREDLIYARAAEHDSQFADDLDSMQRDHDHTAAKGRQLLDTITRWRQGGSGGEALVTQSRAYIDHIYEHMKVEEQLIFPRIESILSQADWRELESEDQLSAVSAPILGPQVQREYRNLARKLRRGVQRAVEHQVVEEWIEIEAVMESYEAIALAYESSRHVAGEHFRTALKDAAGILINNPLTAPFKIAANNTRVTVDLIAEVASISKEAVQDLVKVNTERADRLRLLEGRSNRS